MEKFKYRIERDKEKVHETDKIYLLLGDDQFRITKDDFGGFQIQKCNFGKGSSRIQIEPNVSNEIVIK